LLYYQLVKQKIWLGFEPVKSYLLVVIILVFLSFFFIDKSRIYQDIFILINHVNSMITEVVRFVFRPPELRTLCIAAHPSHL